MQTARRLGFVVLALILGSLAVVEPPATAKADTIVVEVDTYAAIAYSPSTGKWGTGQGYPWLNRARERALAECDADDARIIGWVENGFIALALGDDVGAYGYGSSSNSATARAIALRECAKRTTGAHVVVVKCSAGD
jgi:hypothetical protein